MWRKGPSAGGAGAAGRTPDYLPPGGAFTAAAGTSALRQVLDLRRFTHFCPVPDLTPTALLKPVAGNNCAGQYHACRNRASLLRLQARVSGLPAFTDICQLRNGPLLRRRLTV